MPGTVESLLGIDAPIVLGPFGGLSSVALTAIVSERGGLGSYGLYGYPPERIPTRRELRAATARPFALNLWLPTGDEVTPDGGLGAVPTPSLRSSRRWASTPPEPPAAFLPDIGSSWRR